MNTFEDVIVSVGKVFSSIGTAGTVLILLAPLLLLLLILVPVMASRGYKKGLFLSLVSLGSTVISYVAAVLLSKPFSKLLGSVIYKVIRKNAIPEDAKASAFIDGSGHLTDFANGLLTAVSAIILFALIFLILLIIAKVVLGKILEKKLAADDGSKGLKWGGLGVRILDAVLIAFMFLVPLYSFAGSAAKAMKNVTAEIQNGEYETVEYSNKEEFDNSVNAIDQTSDAIGDMLAVKVSSKSFIGFSYRFLGGFDCGGTSYNAYDLLSDSTELLSDAMPFIAKKTDQYGAYEIGKVDQATAYIKDHSYFAGFFVDFCNNADETLLSSDKPGEEAKDEMYGQLLKGLKGCTEEEVNDAVDKLGDSMKALIENKVFKNNASPIDAIKSIHDKPLIERIDRNLRTSSLLSRMTDTVLAEVFKSLGKTDSLPDKASSAELTKICDEVIDNINNKSIKTDEDIRMESAAIVRVLNALTELDNSLSKISEMQFETMNTDAFADLFVGIAVHPYCSPEQASEIIRILLPQLGDQAKTVFVDKTMGSVTETIAKDVNKIKAGGEAYALRNLLRSFKNMTLAMMNMRLDDRSAKEKLQAVVGDLLDDMSTESASIIKDNLTPEMIEDLGGSKENSEQIVGFVTDLLDNIASSDGGSESDKKAIAEMSSLVMNAAESFGEGGKVDSLESAVGGDLTEFVRITTDSDIMMKTLTEAVDKNGIDPTGGFANLSESDRNALRGACENVYRESGENAGKLNELNKILEFYGVEKIG